MIQPKKVTLSHWGEYLIYRGIETTLRILPLRFVFFLGSLLGRLAYRLLPRYRYIAQRNLRIAYAGEKNLAQINTLTHELFKRIGANMISSIRTAFLSEKKLHQHVTLEAATHYQKAFQRKQGIVLLIPHMGNWELLAQCSALAGLPVKGGTHYRPLNNPLMNRLIEKRRQRNGVTLFAKRSSSHAMTAFLREGGFLGILADQRAGSRGDLHPYFGRFTTCSPLPALLAKRSDALLLGLSCSCTAPAKWTLRFTPLSGTDTAACMDNIEEACRFSPQDVFWLQNRWKIENWLALKHRDGLTQTQKPYRLLFLPGHSRRNKPSESVTLSLPLTEKIRPDTQLELASEEKNITAPDDRQWSQIHPPPTSPHSHWLQAISEKDPLPLDVLIVPEGEKAHWQSICKKLTISLLTY